MQNGPRRLGVSMFLGFRLGHPPLPGFRGQNEVWRRLYQMQLGLSLVSGQDGFETAAHLQIQAGNHGIGGQGGSLLAWNLQRTRWIQRGSISYYALRLFSNWWRIPEGRQVAFDFQGRLPHFVGNHTILQAWIQLVSN